MKFVVYATMAAGLFHIAAAVNVTVTETVYTDDNCRTAAASTSRTRNPFVSTLDICTLYAIGSVETQKT
jgi:hypothetical protein